MSWVVQLMCQKNAVCLFDPFWSVLNITRIASSRPHYNHSTCMLWFLCELMWFYDIPWHDMIRDDQRLSFALGTLVQVPEEADCVFQHCPGQCLPSTLSLLPKYTGNHRQVVPNLHHLRFSPGAEVDCFCRVLPIQEDKHETSYVFQRISCSNAMLLNHSEMKFFGECVGIPWNS